MFGLILAAGGASSRFGGSVPKVLAPLAGKPVVRHALETFLSVAGPWDVVLAAPGPLVPAFEAAVERRARVVVGGATRQESVARAFAALTPHADPVLVHDAARPLIDAETIEAVLAAIEEKGAAAAVLPATDSTHLLAPGDTNIETALPRDRVVRAQTPQGARRALFEAALADAAAAARAVTDEIGLLRAVDTRVVAVPGSPRNLKITTPDDLAHAKHLLEFDIHA